MRFRTLALAVALSCGVTGVVDATARKPAVRRAKNPKIKKQKKFKRAKAYKVKKSRR